MESHSSKMKRRAETTLEATCPKRSLIDDMEEDWDKLMEDRFRLWAQLLSEPRPPPLAVFMKRLNPIQGYTTDQIKVLLISSGFKGDSWFWALQQLQTSITNHGFGQILHCTEDVGHFYMYPELLAAHRCFFGAPRNGGGK